MLTISKWSLKNHKIKTKIYLIHGIRLLIKHFSCLTGEKRKCGFSSK